MDLPYLYNKSLDYTVNIVISPESIASFSLYPIIMALLGIAPLILAFIILGLNLPSRTKALLFFLNAFFSAIIPIINNFLVSYLTVLQYVYLAVTNDIALFNTISSFVLIAANFNADLSKLAIGMTIINTILGVFYIFLDLKEKKII